MENKCCPRCKDYDNDSGPACANDNCACHRLSNEPTTHPTTDWRADNDFVANLYGLLRGMDTPRKTEVLKFIENMMNRELSLQRDKIREGLEGMKDHRDEKLMHDSHEVDMRESWNSALSEAQKYVEGV